MFNRLHIISATRCSPDAFPRTTFLGRSLARLGQDDRFAARFAWSNTHGLSTIYNHVIRDSGSDDSPILFVHDDVFIDDFNVFFRLEEALRVFDIVGVAGSTLIEPDHVAWCFRLDKDNQIVWRDKNILSGAVAHDFPAGAKVNRYGHAPQPCALLDGCFLAVNPRRLREAQVFFDEQFKFHFYDLDFCRTAASRGLRLGTWPIAITHASGGNFGKPDWLAALNLYRQKWKDAPSAIENRSSPQQIRP